MAKRMQYSVVGLPHYTIWHLYEPSVDDIRHMEEMEKERKQREQEEKEKQERMEKISNQFEEGKAQWEQDKEAIRDTTKKEAVEKHQQNQEAQQRAEEASKKTKEVNDDEQAPSKA